MTFILFFPYLHYAVVSDTIYDAVQFAVCGDLVFAFSSARDYYEWVETQNQYLIAVHFIIDPTQENGIYTLRRKNI